MSKSFFCLLLLLAGCVLPAAAQFDADTDNGVVSLAGREGVRITSRDGRFLFRPYLLVQGAASVNYYDDAGLDPAYNQDNIANSGFSIPYAVLGFTGRAFGIVQYNLSINAAASGGALLQQAWADVQPSAGFGVRFGKFKTPFSHAYLTTLGETLFPVMPLSLTSQVILPYSLNAVTPGMGTGFDLGLEFHGFFPGRRFTYQAGIFNGTGPSVNTVGKTFSDDWHIPSLLYAARFTWQPLGMMPASQGSPYDLRSNRLLLGLSGSLNVESENESTNDLRVGVDFAWNCRRLYIGVELYWMNIGFTRRQKIDRSFNYLGGYLQAGYFITDRLQGALRYELWDRNGLDKGGLLNIPSVGANYFFPGLGIKLQAMYRYVGRTGHARQLDRDEDNLGLATHTGWLQVQYTF